MRLVNFEVDMAMSEDVTEADLLGAVKALAGLWAMMISRRRDTAMVMAAAARPGSFAAFVKRRERKLPLMGYEVLLWHVRCWCQKHGHADLVKAADEHRERRALDRLLEDVKAAGGEPDGGQGDAARGGGQ